MPACKRLTLLLWLLWACACSAEDAVSPPACSDGVCVINVFSTSLIAPPCVDDSVLVAYSQASGATLIQCSDRESAKDNKAFVYDRHKLASTSFEFRGGRFIRPDYLVTAVSEGIPDKFGAVPLCAVKERRPAASGELLLAEKQPNDSPGAPYCYRIHYVVVGKAGLQVIGDNGKELPALSPAAATAWTKLRQDLSPYIDPKSDGAATAPQASVRSDKARLFQSPNLDSRTRMYLVKGDHVGILDDSQLNTGWCKVRYLPKSGKSIEAWMQSSDLDRSQK